jgi:hypothetical protein
MAMLVKLAKVSSRTGEIGCGTGSGSGSGTDSEAVP